MKTLGIGIFGARYEARMHYTIFQKLPKALVEIRGIYSRTLESAKPYTKDAGISFVTNDLDKLLARKDIDVIDICTPQVSHHEIAIRAAEARIVMLD